MSDRINALGIQSTKSDTAKARVLAAIRAFAESVGDDDLAGEARALMPSADPFQPPLAWRDNYYETFPLTADEECNVSVYDMPRYCVEYWQGMSDAERQARLENPALGRRDGTKDAEALNEA
jgi:hypothetical protein